MSRQRSEIFRIATKSFLENFLWSTIEGMILYINYRNDPKFSDMPGQTVQTQIRLLLWSGSTLFAIPSASFGLITLW